MTLSDIYDLWLKPWQASRKGVPIMLKTILAKLFEQVNKFFVREAAANSRAMALLRSRIVEISHGKESAQ